VENRKKQPFKTLSFHRTRLSRRQIRKKVNRKIQPSNQLDWILWQRQCISDAHQKFFYFITFSSKA